MDFTKREYYISTYTGPQLVSGIIAEYDGFCLGIHKDDGDWFVDDLGTGTYLFIFDTRKEAKNWIEGNIEDFSFVELDNEYQELKKNFERRCRFLQ